MASQALATLDDLENYGPRSATFGDIDDPTKTKGLLAASSIAASYMKKRFSFPLVQWGEDLRKVVCDIATYFLMTSRGFAPNAGLDNVIIQNYRDATGEQGKLGWLNLVALGRVEPDDIIDASSDLEEAAPLVDSDEARDWDFGMSGGSSSSSGGCCGSGDTF